MRLLRYMGFELLVDYKQYGKLWLGNLFSAFGDQAGWIALIWMVMHLTGNPASIGLVTLLYKMPQVITSPISGVCLDRFPRAKVMAIGNFLLSILFVAIATLALSGDKQFIGWIYVLITLAGMVQPLNSTGSGSLIVELIPSDKLSRANFLSQMEWQLSTLLGPALGGIIIASIGTIPILYADAFTFLVVSLVLWTLPSSSVQLNSEIKKDSPWGSFVSGMKYTIQHRSLIAFTLLTVLFNFFYGPYEVILPVLSKNTFGGAGALGLMWTMFAVGAIIGSLLFSRVRWRWSLSLSLSAIIILWGLVTIAMAYLSHLYALLLILFIAGFVFSPWGPLVITVRQRMIPLHMQSRVIGTSQSLTIIAMPLGAWIAGMGLNYITANKIFFYAGLTTVLVGLIGSIWPTFRKIDAYSE